MQKLDSMFRNYQKWLAFGAAAIILTLLSAQPSVKNNVSASSPSEAYSLVRQWGTRGTDNGQLLLPWSVALDSSGNVYVDDRNNGRIEKFDNNGNYITAWRVGPTDQYPIDLAIDSSNNVYVSSSR